METIATPGSAPTTGVFEPQKDPEAVGSGRRAFRMAWASLLEAAKMGDLRDAEGVRLPELPVVRDGRQTFAIPVPDGWEAFFSASTLYLFPARGGMLVQWEVRKVVSMSMDVGLIEWDAEAVGWRWTLLTDVP